MPKTSNNVVAVAHRISDAERAAANNHQSGVLWMTGLPGSGKSTLALSLEHRLFAMGYQVYVLDGDNLRHGLNGDLGFSPEDRAENIRRAGELAALFADAGTIVITAFISPYQADRDLARKASSHFHEIHISTPIEVCEQRDPKGHYKRARTGEITEFTGVSAPYEDPPSPELAINTDGQTIEDITDTLVAYVEKNFAN
jgi:bifunctional enzyme CysN/CysC